MRTPMQELIERLDKEINPKYPDGYNIVMKIAKNLTEQMLEKEKEVIIQTSVNAYTAGYLDNQAKVDDSMNFPEEYYNETFKNKREMNKHPNDLTSVIAQIEHLTDLGISRWYEVVYYSDGEWHSYAGSNTFKDGEKVLQWKYCDDIFNTKEK